ncbi:Sterol uptake control protein 2, partial [Colletotrichum shisoi]
MDAEPSSVASSWAGSAASKSANRKERGHIAQRACEVCRRRKQKCDEEKPTCGYCFKAKLECDYGSPKPTNPHVIEDHARIYFNTFNRIHPVLDRQYFMGVVFPGVLMNNFDEDASSTLLCLVLALAEVAMADVSGRGLLSFQDQPRKPDDTTEKIEYRPPGIEFFNEARRRLGFSMGDDSLENIQMYILAGNPAELDAAHGDQICRVFWYCSIAETSLQLEPQLPLTGLDKLEPSIQLPQFPEYVTTTDQLLRAQMYNDRMSHYGEIFSYQISLRNLAVKVHDGLKR